MFEHAHNWKLHYSIVLSIIYLSQLLLSVVTFLYTYDVNMLLYLKRINGCI